MTRSYRGGSSGAPARLVTDPRETGGHSRYKRPVHPALPRLAATFAAAALLALATLAPTAGAQQAGTPSSCSRFGPTWERTYNARATLAGNPIRILAACCRPTGRVGINHCFVTVTLAGTKDRGCESVDIGPNGLPAGPGKHETCTNIA